MLAGFISLYAAALPRRQTFVFLAGRRLQFVFIQIIQRIHIRLNDSIYLNCPVFKFSVQSDAFLAVIADLCRIKIAKIALSAFYARPIIQNAVPSVHNIAFLTPN